MSLFTFSSLSLLVTSLPLVISFHPFFPLIPSYVFPVPFFHSLSRSLLLLSQIRPEDPGETCLITTSPETSLQISKLSHRALTFCVLQRFACTYHQRLHESCVFLSAGSITNSTD